MPGEGINQCLPMRIIMQQHHRRLSARIGIGQQKPPHPPQQPQQPLPQVVPPVKNPQAPLKGILRNPGGIPTGPLAVSSPDPASRRSGILRQPKFASDVPGDSQILERLTSLKPKPLGKELDRADIRGQIKTPNPAQTGVAGPTETQTEGGAVGGPTTPTPSPSATTEGLQRVAEELQGLEDAFSLTGRSTRSKQKLPDDVLHRFPDDRKKKKK